MYVDESGDPGISPNASKHYILSGLIISQADWDKYLGRLKTFRKSIKTKYGLNMRTEIHAAELIRVKDIEEYKAIRKTDRISIIRDYCSEIPIIFDSAFIINICIKKDEHIDQDIFKLAWGRLLQRFDTFLKKDVKDKGIVITDDVNNISLLTLQRKMRVYNPVSSQYSSGSYNAPIDNIIEDSFPMKSHNSYFIQTVDVISHMLYRKEYPKGSLKKYGIEIQFQKLDAILLKKASSKDAYGVVRR